jgi:hypothetical protein
MHCLLYATLQSLAPLSHQRKLYVQYVQKMSKFLYEWLKFVCTQVKNDDHIVTWSLNKHIQTILHQMFFIEIYDFFFMDEK